MYQLYHIGTDTKRAFQPLRNQLFLGACLTTWLTTTYGTFVGSGLPAGPPSRVGVSPLLFSTATDAKINRAEHGQRQTGAGVHQLRPVPPGGDPTRTGPGESCRRTYELWRLFCAEPGVTGRPVAAHL